MPSSSRHDRSHRYERSHSSRHHSSFSSSHRDSHHRDSHHRESRRSDSRRDRSPSRSRKDSRRSDRSRSRSRRGSRRSHRSRSRSRSRSADKHHNDQDQQLPPKPSQDMNLRMTALLQQKGNQRCADCPERRPLWASFLVSPIEEDKQFGVFVCASCAQHHHFELGEKRTMIKYLKMAHECKFLDPFSCFGVFSYFFLILQTGIPSTVDQNQINDAKIDPSRIFRPFSKCSLLSLFVSPSLLCFSPTFKNQKTNFHSKSPIPFYFVNTVTQ